MISKTRAVLVDGLDCDSQCGHQRRTRRMSMHDAKHVRPRSVDLHVNRPFPYLRAFGCRTIYTPALVIEHDEIRGSERFPTRRARLDKDSLVIQPGAQVPGKSVSSGARGK